MLEEILLDVGFKQIKLLPPKESIRSDIFQECLNMEYEKDFDYPHTLLIEAIKWKKLLKKIRKSFFNITFLSISNTFHK